MTEPVEFENISVGDKVVCIKPQGDYDLKYEFTVARRTVDNLFTNNGTAFSNTENFYKWELVESLGYPFTEEPVFGWLTTEVSGIADIQLAFVSTEGYQKIGGQWMPDLTAVQSFSPAVAIPEDLYLELIESKWDKLQAGQLNNLRSRLEFYDTTP